MSWFTTPKSFAGGTKAKAAEVNEDFAAIAEAFNTLVQGGKITPSGDLSLTTSYQDVPGASKALTVPRSSLLYVWLDVVSEGTGEGGGIAEISVNVNGSDLAPPTGANPGSTSRRSRPAPGR